MTKLTVILLLLASGCAPDITDTDFYSRHPDEPIGGDELVNVASASVEGYYVAVLASSDLHFGPNTLLVAFVRNGEPVVSGNVVARALWVTEERELAPPYGEASASIANDDDRFELLVHLLEPVGEAGEWVLEVDFDFDATVGNVRSKVKVEPDIWVQHVAGSEPAEDYYLSWIQPARPSTGEALLELAMHRLTENGFEAITSASLDLFPYMDMGAGEGHSTPFDPPVHSNSGLYRGSVNFIMAGGWDMTVFVQGNGRDDTVLFRGFTVH